MDDQELDRRTLLQGSSLAAALAIAGCTVSTPWGDFELEEGDVQDGDEGGNGESTTTQTATQTESPTETDPSLSLSAPDEYVAGDSVSVTGTASGDIDQVVVVARGTGDWQAVSFGGQATLSVDSGSFGVQNVVLSDGAGGGNEVLATAGSYEIGVIRTADVTGGVDESTRISAENFDAGITDKQVISVISPSISLNAPPTYHPGDPVTLEGQATGVAEVVIVARSPREDAWEIVVLNGQTTLSVDSESFEAQNVLLDDGNGGGNEVFERFWSDPGAEIAAIRAADIPESIDESTRISKYKFNVMVTDIESIEVEP